MSTVTADSSTAGLLLSLSHACPAKALRRRARALARRLARPHPRALETRASDLLADLLNAADADLAGYPEDGVIDADFDRL